MSLDGTDVSGVAIEGSATRRLNRPSQATIKIPMDAAIGCAGSRLKISFDGGATLFFHGMVMDCETDSGEDEGYTVYNASDPMELWNWRVVRADDGDFSKPAGDGGANDLLATYITGPQIMEAVLKNTEGDSTAQGNPALTPPADAEGPTFLDFGSFTTGGAILSGAPTDFPQSIAQFASLLISTGELDLVITPTDPGGGVMGTIDGYNGDYGTDLSGLVLFSYGMGALNVRRMRWNEDMSTMVNKLWYYGGPRIETAADPAGDQHWCWNITGDDPAFNPAGNPTGAWANATAYFIDDVVTNVIGGDTYYFIAHEDHTSSASDEPGVGANWAKFWFSWMVPPGGRNSPPASSTDNPLGVRRIDSQTSAGCTGDGYGVRMEVRIYDALSDLCAGGSSYDPGRDLYRRLWQIESWLRAVPRSLIHVTPIRGYGIGAFDIGDLVGVEAAASVRGGFSGAQRVYGYTISWDEDGPFELSELQTSADQEGV